MLLMTEVLHSQPLGPRSEVDEASMIRALPGLVAARTMTVIHNARKLIYYSPPYRGFAHHDATKQDTLSGARTSHTHSL